MTPFFRHTEPGDLHELAATMSQADLTEVSLLTDQIPLKVLQDSFEASTQCFTIVLDGRVLAVLGVTGHVGTRGAPWMLSTDDVYLAKPLIKDAKAIVQSMLSAHGFLANFVWSKNARHISFINFLGFEFTGDAFERSGEKFLWFAMQGAVQ